MQKWEYIFLTATWNEGWKVELVNGETVEDWQDGPSMFDYVNELGQQGWDMISWQYFSTFDHDGLPPEVDYEHYRMALKRAI